MCGVAETHRGASTTMLDIDEYIMRNTCSKREDNLRVCWVEAPLRIDPCELGRGLALRSFRWGDRNSSTYLLFNDERQQFRHGVLRGLQLVNPRRLRVAKSIEAVKLCGYLRFQ